METEGYNINFASDFLLMVKNRSQKLRILERTRYVASLKYLSAHTQYVCPTLKYGFAPIICFDFLESDTFFDVVKDVTIGRFLFRVINVL